MYAFLLSLLFELVTAWYTPLHIKIVVFVIIIDKQVFLYVLWCIAMQYSFLSVLLGLTQLPSSSRWRSYGILHRYVCLLNFCRCPSCWWLVVSAPWFWSDIVRFTSLFQLFLIFWMLQKIFLVHLIVDSRRPPTSLAHYTFLDTWYNSPTTTLLILVYLSKRSLLFVHSSFFLSSWTFVQIWIFLIV